MAILWHWIAMLIKQCPCPFPWCNHTCSPCHWSCSNGPCAMYELSLQCFLSCFAQSFYLIRSCTTELFSHTLFKMFPFADIVLKSFRAIGFHILLPNQAKAMKPGHNYLCLCYAFDWNYSDLGAIDRWVWLCLIPSSDHRAHLHSCITLQAKEGSVT